jgi:hypothetical protein
MNQQLIQTVLKLFKINKGIRHDLRDELFLNLIESSYTDLEKMGMSLTEATAQDIQLVLEYANWYYDNRSGNVGLPRNLQFKIHNRVVEKVVLDAKS